MTGTATHSIIIGIDPGQTGAIATIWPHSIGVIDMPPTAKDLVDALKHYAPGFYDWPAMAFVEQAQSMPGQGVSSTFKYGVGYGTILGVLTALGIAHRLVAPATWKRQMHVTKDKNAARQIAQQLFPTAPLSRVKDHGRAEALLLAEWGRRQGGQP